jgi:hypothetical protein
VETDYCSLIVLADTVYYSPFASAAELDTLYCIVKPLVEVPGNAHYNPTAMAAVPETVYGIERTMVVELDTSHYIVLEMAWGHLSNYLCIPVWEPEQVPVLKQKPETSNLVEKPKKTMNLQKIPG